MYLLLIFFVLIINYDLASCVTNSPDNVVQHDNHFDLLIFTQHWPFTTCIDYENRSKKNSCSRIQDKVWSVHGLWPTQIGKIAPNFCNTTWKFEYSSVANIRSDLDVYWPDYELRAHPNSLWTHEWEKHGTCAAQLTALGSEEKYFQAGIDLGKQIRLTEWLKEKNIVPGGRYTKDEVYNAVIEKTKVRPHIDCEFMDGLQFIKEIKVCFSKNLTLVHCDNIIGDKTNIEGDNLNHWHNSTGSCHEDKEFLYPAKMNPAYLSSLTSNHLTIGFLIFGCGLLVIMSLMVSIFVKQGSTRGRSGYESL